MENIPSQIPFDGLRIVLYGPESTGKSTLASQLSKHYNAPKVEEFARDFLQEKFDVNNHLCTYEDILPIAIGQRMLENTAAQLATKILICDTDILETYVYCTAYFAKAPTELKSALETSRYDHYLLLDIDTPWKKDNLRDKPNEREQMFDRFEEALKKRELPFTKISGLGNQRFLNATAAIDKLI